MIKVDDFTGTDQEKVDQAIGKRIVDCPEYLTQTLVFTERTWRLERPIVFPKHTSVDSDGCGARSINMVFDGPGITDDCALITAHKPRDDRFTAFRLTGGKQVADRTGVVGLRIISGSSSTFDHFFVDMKPFGANSVGVQTLRQDINAESVTIEKFGAVSSHPLVYACNGDNTQIRDFDLTGQGEVTSSSQWANACIQIVNGTSEWPTPSHVYIGPGTIQRRKQGFRCVTDVTSTASGLFLDGIRWEQGEYVEGESYTGFEIDINRTVDGVRRHALEMCSITNCKVSHNTCRYGFFARGVIDGMLHTLCNDWGNGETRISGRPY